MTQTHLPEVSVSLHMDTQTLYGNHKFPVNVHLQITKENITISSMLFHDSTNIANTSSLV